MKSARQYRPMSALMLSAFFAVATAGAAYTVALRIGVEDLGRRGDQLLELISSTLKDEFERTAALPGALIEFAELAEIDRAKNLTPLNALLKRVARESGVSDLFVLDYIGVNIAASHGNKREPFVGRRLGFQPYYYEALLHGRGAYHAVRMAGGGRDFYFSRVFRSRATGQRHVLVARIDAARMERALSDPLLVLVDPNGVVFLSSEPKLLFTSLSPLSARKREDLAQNRQYERTKIRTLPTMRVQRIAGREVVRFAGARWVAFGVRYREAVRLTRDFRTEVEGLGGFRAMVFVDASRARAAAVFPSLAAGFGVFILALGVYGLIARRRAAIEQLKAKERVKIELEQRVADRTAALRETNARLEREAEERRAAAAALAKAERELVLAQKLAALGRLSADVSHELNQPLAAIRAYAENAEAFLARGRTDAAMGNLSRIGVMSERISRIIANLRVFARGQAPPARPVKLSEALDDALQLVSARLAEVDVSIERAGDAWDANAMFGRVRLAQVFVNLLNNAADAMEGQAVRRIILSARETPSALVIDIRDTGPGLAPEIAETLFDPFVSTKGVDAGPGLGLGLSIVYGLVKSVGGALSARNHPDGGAEFTLRLLHSMPGPSEQRSATAVSAADRGDEP
ncbi:MAG: ATP-binding protein [Neomegalonema sp.]|nr:ATP-binding protein [Neomegalonema sp.]